VNAGWRYRVGRRNGHTIYLYQGGPTDSDMFVGSCTNPRFAAELVDFANAGLDAVDAIHRLRGTAIPDTP
jgi:hypothetical protein